MTVPARLRVTSADFTRQFGQLCQASGNEPVFITRHGRETHVLLTVARYHEVQVARRGDSGDRLPPVQTMAEWVRQGIVVVDRQSTVVLANGVAHAMLDRAECELVGHGLFEAVPELEGSLVQVYLRRALAGREPCAADLPAVFGAAAWMRLEIFPAAGGATLLFHDITDDVQAHRLADACGCRRADISNMSTPRPARC